MANIEEKTRKVLNGLLHHAAYPENSDQCAGCLYHEDEDDFCISRLCRDAYSVITTLDTTINAMMGAYGDSCDAEGCHPDGGDA